MPKRWQVASDHRPECKWLVVDGVKTESCGPNQVECCTIIINIPEHGGSIVDGEPHHPVMYHFESGDGMFGRLMIPPSTPFWISVGKRLCKFFGGKIDYNDSDSTDWNRVYRRPRKNNSPTNDEEWDDFQQAMFDLRPVSVKEMKAVNKVAGYQREIE